MGIREYLEKHSEEIKLQEVTVNFDESENVEFDVDELVTDDDWTEAFKDVQELSETKDRLADCANLAMLVKTLSRDHFDELEVPDKVFDFLKKNIGALLGSNKNIFKAAKRVWLVKNTFPERMRELDLDTLAQKMKDELAGYLEEEKWQQYALFAMYFRMIFPSRIDEIDLSDKTLKKVKNNLDEVSDDPNSFVYRAAVYKIAFMERAVDIKLDQHFFAMAKELLEKRREKNSTTRFFDGVVDIKIIMASEIKIDNDGLRLLMEEPDFKVKKTSRPERKSF